MRYVAALDYDHLDNGVFLTSLARSLSQQKDKQVRSIIVHGDSAYTERIIQTGVMREEAIVRSVKDLNHRLVALFADQGVSTVALNPYQRNLITVKQNKIQLDREMLSGLPDQPVLLLSNLVQDLATRQPEVLPLPRLTQFLYEELEADQLFLFSKSDESEIFVKAGHPQKVTWNTADEAFLKKQIPDEFQDFHKSIRLTSARDFNHIPDLKHTIAVEAEK